MFHLLALSFKVVNWEKDPVDAKYITKTILKALETRKANGLPVATERSAFRLVNGLSDGMPGINIDLYGIYAVIHVYSAHWQLMVMDIAKSLFSIDRAVEGVYTINRTRRPTSMGDSSSQSTETKAKSQCVWGKRAPEHRTIVEENGLLYHTQLDNGPAIGLYLDQRQNRQKVVELLKKVRARKADETSKDISEPPRLLNTFSFTGSFSLAGAKLAGATTTSVDASELVQLWAKDNFVLNGLHPEDHEFIKKDVFSALSGFSSTGRLFDVVVLDPPTISRVKVRGGTSGSSTATTGTLSYTPAVSSTSKTYFSSLDNYSDLVALASPLVAPEGYLVCFVNTHSLDKEHWRGSIGDGLESLIPKMVQHHTEERQNTVRGYLRKRGVKSKYRPSIIDRHSTTSVTEEMIRDQYTFDVVDHWNQDLSDFTALPGDSMGHYLHGIVLQRRAPLKALPPVTLPIIRAEHLHATRRGSLEVGSPLTDELRDKPIERPTTIKKTNTSNPTAAPVRKGPWSAGKAKSL